MLSDRANELSESEPSDQERGSLVALFNQGKYEEAAALARTMTVRFPHHGFGWKALGTVFQQLGLSANAVVPLRNAATLWQDDPDTFNNLGSCLRRLGQLDEAKVSYFRALEIRPDHAGVHNNLGNTYRELGQLRKAEASYQRALEIDRNYAEGHKNLGDFLLHLGRKEEALVQFRLSVKAKGEWKVALRRLTTPLVLDTGLALGSPVGICTKRDQIANPSDPVVNATTCPKSNSAPQAKRNLRILLIYPPPWQIPSAGETLWGMPFGPPRNWGHQSLGVDFQTITYGLLTIAAQAKHAGHNVDIYNLSACSWQGVVKLIAENEADIYGISAFTANRRGMGAVAALIRHHHPLAHITVGGPFVTALPVESLTYFPEIDTAVIGEGEDTFMELLECLESGRPTVGIPGTAWRSGAHVYVGPSRPRIKNLDALASPYDYFTSYMVMTSRGCPSKCTFCGSFTTWGKKLRFLSVESCIDAFKKALARLPVSFIAIKDDTFTAHRRRAIEICDAIIENKLNFVWSCDTRVDCLDDELLHKMRLAGCQIISLGIESGSPEILKSIRKEITPDMVLKATRLAHKYGMYVRYYMILINREETPESIQQSVDLIKTGRPDMYVFSPLSFYPGTEDWKILCEQQGLSPEVFFRNDFKELTVTENRNRESDHVFLHIICGIGAIDGFTFTVEEREAVAARIPCLHIAQVELANAYFRDGRLDEATAALNRAEELGFPIGGVINNQRACIALARNEIGNAFTLLERALDHCPCHTVAENLKNLRAWVETPASDRGKLLLDDSVLALNFCSVDIT